MQNNILDKQSDAHLKVYAIWTDKLATDARWRWDAADLIDRRVKHYWDADNVSGAWLAKNLGSRDVGDWDAYFLFGPDARWDRKPAPMAGAGSTVLGEGRQLAAEIAGLGVPVGKTAGS